MLRSGWWLCAAGCFWLGRVAQPGSDHPTGPARKAIAHAMMVVFFFVLTPVPFMLLAP